LQFLFVDRVRHSMLFDQIETKKRQYTDKYVTVDASRPELARFRDAVGQVKTVNMSGRALVEFMDYHLNIGWYDIDPAFLRIVDKPAPKAAKPEAKKPAAKAEGRRRPRKRQRRRRRLRGPNLASPRSPTSLLPHGAVNRLPAARPLQRPQRQNPSPQRPLRNLRQRNPPPSIAPR
jgi:hypothetical protein